MCLKTGMGVVYPKIFNSILTYCYANYNSSVSALFLNVYNFLFFIKRNN